CFGCQEIEKHLGKYLVDISILDEDRGEYKK
ncbi:hypothetical protein LCGC14_1301600, partial [marine sediment metagenome]